MVSKAHHAGWVLPVDVRPVKSHRPCESCGVRSVRYRATMNPPGHDRVTFRLCSTCVQAVNLNS